MEDEVAVFGLDVGNKIIPRLERDPAFENRVKLVGEKPWERSRGGREGGSWRGSIGDRYRRRWKRRGWGW